MSDCSVELLEKSSVQASAKRHVHSCAGHLSSVLPVSCLAGTVGQSPGVQATYVDRPTVVVLNGLLFCLDDESVFVCERSPVCLVRSGH